MLLLGGYHGNYAGWTVRECGSKELIGFDEAMQKLSREELFRSTVYAMNTLLVQKGIYSPEEFEFQFRQFAQKQLG